MHPTSHGIQNACITFDYICTSTQLNCVARCKVWQWSFIHATYEKKREKKKKSTWHGKNGNSGDSSSITLKILRGLDRRRHYYKDDVEHEWSQQIV